MPLALPRRIDINPYFNRGSVRRPAIERTQATSQPATGLADAVAITQSGRSSALKSRNHGSRAATVTGSVSAVAIRPGIDAL